MLNTKKKKMKEEILSQINDMLDIMPDKKLATVKIKKVKLEKKAKKMALIKLFYEFTKSYCRAKCHTSLLENTEKYDE